MAAPSLDKFLGCFYGGAIGDALGAPYSGRPSTAIALGEPQDLTFTRLPAYPLGQTTDDTQMMLTVARSIVAAGTVDGSALAQALQDLWDSGQVLAARPTNTQAIETMKAGAKPWYAAGVPPPCPDVGSLTRAIPIGLWRCQNARELVRDVELCSRLTHGDERAAAGAVAVARAAAFMATHDQAQPERCLYRVGLAVGQVMPDFSDWILELSDVVYHPQPEASQRIWKLAARVQSDGDGVAPTSHVVYVTLWSLYCALHAMHDFRAALHMAISAGGETEVAAAVVGAIVGAHLGASGLPEALVDQMWDQDGVYGAAEDLFKQYREHGGGPAD